MCVKKKSGVGGGNKKPPRWGGWEERGFGKSRGGEIAERGRDWGVGMFSSAGWIDGCDGCDLMIYILFYKYDEK